MASESNASSQSLRTQSQSKKTDPAWKYNYLQNPNDPISVTCKFCKKVTKGGIYRAKLHQIGNNRNARPCSQCPSHVRVELQEYMNGQKAKRNALFDEYMDLDLEQGGFGDDEELDVVEIETPNPNKRSSGCPLSIGGSEKRGKSNTNKALEMLRAKGKGKTTSLRQTNIKDTFDKEQRAVVVQDIARFFYQAGIAFNCVNLDSFKKMIQSIGNYGPHLKPPSYHEIRVPLLKKEVEYTQELLKDHKEEWKRYGCSIMSDGWTDRKQRTLINFMVNCSKGTMFVESVDASSYTKTGSKIFDLLNSFVDRIGEENVVQVITDNGSNYVQAGRFLMSERPHLFWTPCAAHCIDLILEDIGKIGKVKRTISRGVFLVGFIYNHGGVLNMMRQFTNRRELARHGITRFATTFLSLQSLEQQKGNLRKMFDSPMLTPAQQYLTLRSLGAPAVLLSLAMQGMFRGVKDTKTPLYATGIYALYKNFRHFEP